MKIEVANENNNQLLSRREITLKVSDYKSTPNKNELKAEVAARLGGKEENVVIETLRQAYGKNESTAIIKIYESQEALKKFEPKPKEKKQSKEDKPAENK